MSTHKAAAAKATKEQENAVIDVHNLSFAYDDKQIFQHAHLSISASEFVALVGMIFAATITTLTSLLFRKMRAKTIVRFRRRSKSW